MPAMATAATPAPMSTFFFLLMWEHFFFMFFSFLPILL